jgi:hypothetical protein
MLMTSYAASEPSTTSGMSPRSISCQSEWNQDAPPIIPYQIESMTSIYAGPRRPDDLLAQPVCPTDDASDRPPDVEPVGLTEGI